MKNTISEEMKVEIVQEKIINDNLLLQVRRENQANPYSLVAVLRYVEDNTIKENVLCSNLNCHKRLAFGDDAIAVLSVSDVDDGEKTELIDLYDTRTNQLVKNDMKHSIYRERFFENRCAKVLKKFNQ